MVPAIDGVKSGDLVLRVNCPGGDVFAMQAIMNASVPRPSAVCA
jgi:ATP-dependent protease ClpP protease subunit